MTRHLRSKAPPHAAKRAAVFFPRVVVMAKAPMMGLVKTRLSREVGRAEATRIYRATASSMLRRITRDPRFQTILAMAPDAAVTTHGFDRRIGRIAQGGGDLGAKMRRAALRAPPGPVLIIGTDIPSITATILARAHRLLQRNDVVIGPAEDGGFWMIGFRRHPPVDVFAQVRWSHAETRTDVLANLRGRRVALADMLSDIDTAEDVRRLAGHIGRVII